MRYRLETLQENLSSAFEYGSLSGSCSSHASIPLSSLDSGAIISAKSETIDKSTSNAEKVVLEAFADDDMIRWCDPQNGDGAGNDIADSVRALILENNPEDGVGLMNDALHCLLNRRFQRVSQWIEVNSKDKLQEAQIETLTKELQEKHRTLERVYSVCGESCSVCLRPCLLLQQHKSECDCMRSAPGDQDHLCAGLCEFCPENHASCGMKAGHDGLHNCKQVEHLCGEACHLHTQRGCAETCVDKPGHSGEHHCSATRHLCSNECDAPRCAEMCEALYDDAEHTHNCKSGRCSNACMVQVRAPSDGSLKPCGNQCASRDHFHKVCIAQRHFHLYANHRIRHHRHQPLLSC